MKTTYFACALLLLTGAAAGAGETAASDWPQWRGANRDAVSSESGLLHAWPEKGPPVLWRTAAGEGYSGVSVAGGKLYTLWDESEEQFLFGRDAITGKELWRLALGKSFENHYGNGPRSTPIVDGDLVFAIGTEGRLVAANRHTGKPVWQVDLVDSLGARLPSYGYSSSPIVVGDRLVVEVGGTKGSFAAFDRKRGELVWMSQDDRPAYSSPVEATIDGVRQVVFWSAHGLHSVAADDGKLLWKHSWETFCPATGDPLNTGTPVFVAPDRFFISSGSGAAVIRIERAEGRFNVATVWQSERMRSDVNTGLFLDGYIYGFDQGTLQCLNAATGHVMWRTDGYKRGSLIAADGLLIVLGEGGNLGLIEATPNRFVERANVRILDGRNWTAPSLAGGRLYLRNHEELLCLNLTDRGKE